MGSILLGIESDKGTRGNTSDFSFHPRKELIITGECHDACDDSLWYTEWRVVEDFVTEQHVSPCLFVFSIGDLGCRGVGPQTKVLSEVVSVVIDVAAREFAEIKDTIKVDKELFGPYEWEMFDWLILPPSFPYGGMENPRMVSCYKNDGYEEIKLAKLSCLGSLLLKSAGAISPDLLTFVSGLKEKEIIRRGYLRCLQLVCKNTDAVMQMASSLLPLLQLIKSGCTKAPQRLDGVYALFYVLRITVVDVKADETISKEKIRQLILQNELTNIPISLESKFSGEDLMACVDRVEVLIVDYAQRLFETLPTPNINSERNHFPNLRVSGFERPLIGIHESNQGVNNSMFKGWWYQLYAGGTLDTKWGLNNRLCDITIHRDGRLHHTKKCETSGFCYIHDLVLGILEPLKYHAHVLCIDIDVYYGDWMVEQVSGLNEDLRKAMIRVVGGHYRTLMSKLMQAENLHTSGMPHDDLFNINANIVKNLVAIVADNCSYAFFQIISNSVSFIITLLLYKDRSKISASKIKPFQGYAFAGVVFRLFWFCCETIFEALQWWNGRPVSYGLLLGSYILMTSLTCIPIVALHFPHVMAAKKYLVLAISIGLLFIFMQPPTQMAWTYHSDLIRSACHSDDISIYGFKVSNPTWPSWLLIATILLNLAKTYLPEGDVSINKAWLGESRAEDMTVEDDMIAIILAVKDAGTSLLSLYIEIFMPLALEIIDFPSVQSTKLFFLSRAGKFKKMGW